MRRLRRFHSRLQHLSCTVRYKSTRSNINSIACSLPPDDDELNSYAYYGQSKVQKPSQKQQQTIIDHHPQSDTLFSKERIRAPYTYNRWLIPPAALAVHMSIGSVYAWSIFNSPLTRELGVVCSASGDWELQSVMRIFSVSIVCLGLSAASAGKWMESVGPRVIGSLAATLFGGGLMIGSVGIYYHSLPLLYLGYGVCGGAGTTTGFRIEKEWPQVIIYDINHCRLDDSMYAGLAIMGFGGGAIIATPLKEKLLSHYFIAPTYLGHKEDANVIIQNGKQYVQNSDNNSLIEVVYATNADLTQFDALQDGLYAVGSGNTGCCHTFLTLGFLYFIAMNFGAFGYKLPPNDYADYIMKKGQKNEQKQKEFKEKSVSISNALQTTQFYKLWTMLFCNVTAGIGVIGVAKTMMNDIFGGALPNIVDAKFAATYVLMISVFNMLGRFGWASISDYIGRKLTYCCFFMFGIPLYASIPYIAHSFAIDPNVKYLTMFYATTMCIFTMYGGGFATIPAYLADNYGKAEVGGIHGCLLTAWSAAGLVGPSLLGYLRSNSVYDAISNLANNHCDPFIFEQTFGDGIENLDKLIDAKIVTINKLLQICDENTIDPTPYLYDYPMYSMAAVLSIGLLSNLTMKPVDKKYFDIDADDMTRNRK